MFHLNNQSKFNATLFGRGKLFVGRYSSYVVSNPFVSTIDSCPFLLAGKAYFPSPKKALFYSMVILSKQSLVSSSSIETKSSSPFI
jgi:hypothetical protein